jgi:L-lysine exporter family protein LysE/ArgO
MEAFASGLILGFALIGPIGAQNLFVINQGLRTGFPSVLVAIAAAGICDSLLIALGAGGSAAILAGAPRLREVLIVFGVAFLVVLGMRALLTRPDDPNVEGESKWSGIVARSVGVSLLNPHAILDTVGVIGGAIAAQQAADQLSFATGAVSASWLWFLFLGVGAAAMQARLTLATRLWIQRLSGVLMLFFAALLARELF